MILFKKNKTKTNHLVALSKEDKLQGSFQGIDSLNWSDASICGWVKGMNTPIILHWQIFKDKDDSEGISIKTGLTTFGLKTKPYIKTQNEAFKIW